MDQTTPSVIIMKIFHRRGINTSFLRIELGAKFVQIIHRLKNWYGIESWAGYKPGICQEDLGHSGKEHQSQCRVIAS